MSEKIEDLTVPEPPPSAPVPRMRFNGTDFELVIPLAHTHRVFARGVLKDADEVICGWYAQQAAEQSKIQKVSAVQGMKNFVSGLSVRNRR